MTKKKKTVRGKKKFLNNLGHHNVASVAFELAIDENPRTGTPYTSGSFYMNDCSRIVVLDIDFQKKRDYENSLHKLTAIQEVTERAIRDLIALRKIYLAEKKKAKNENRVDDGNSITLTMYE